MTQKVTKREQLYPQNECDGTKYDFRVTNLLRRMTTTSAFFINSKYDDDEISS